jgi:hypothetical protein
MTQRLLTNTLAAKAFRFALIAMRLRTIASLIVMMGGCGDGYDSPVATHIGPGPDPDARTGFLSASPASGVSYETATQSGVTDEDGEFFYREGESVRFFLGDTTLGETAGQVEVTAFDLAAVEPLTTGSGGFLEQRAEVSHAANIATLLQTFDYDGNPSNGIEITPEVASLFDGVEVDLGRDIFDFIRERSFRSVLNRANDEGLLETYRAPRGGIAVMEHLYAELGLSTGFFALSSESFDNDADGTVEQINEYTYAEKSIALFQPTSGPMANTQEFDDYGNPISSVHEDSGVITSSAKSTSDADGNLVVQSSDSDGNGETDSSSRSFYNEFGDLLGWESDAGVDGVIERAASLEYDERGNTSRFERDDDADGNPNHVEAKKWDENRQIIVRSIDREGDGTFEVAMVSEYDEGGHMVRQTLHVDGNELPSSIKLWRHDERGLETFHSRDSNADGVPNFFEFSQYDADRHILMKESDHDGDGEIDRVETWLHDAEGNELRYEDDEDNDSVVDLILSYEYDADGNRTRAEEDHNGDGTPERIVTKTYVPAGWDYVFYRLRWFELAN